MNASERAEKIWNWLATHSLERKDEIAEVAAEIQAAESEAFAKGQAEVWEERDKFWREREDKARGRRDDCVEGLRKCLKVCEERINRLIKEKFDAKLEGYRQAREDASRMAEKAPCTCGVWSGRVADDIRALPDPVSEGEHPKEKL